MAEATLDVAIAGAGPAGISCAVALIRRDPSLKGRISVFDRARFPRSKPCGGGLTGRADQAMRALGLELTVPSMACDRGLIRFADLDRSVSLGRPVRIVRREEFDASLVAQARDLGVVVQEETPLEDFSVDADGVSFSAGGARRRAKILVGADGVSSRVRKRILDRAGTPDGRPIRLFRSELSVSRAVWQRYADTMVYDFSLFPNGMRGYFWIFPVPGDRLNVGVMHDPSTPLSGGDLERLLQRQLQKYGLPMAEAVRGWPAWGYDSSRAVSSQRLLLVGDAAGIDALTGEGIAVGMEEGPLAADQILVALRSGEFGFGGYREALRHATVGRELALDRQLARLLYHQERWKKLLPLILFDQRMVEMYAARVSGSLILTDQKPALLAALIRHALHYRSRKVAFGRALAVRSPLYQLRNGVPIRVGPQVGSDHE